MNHVRFFVPGLALPQGSAKAFVVKGKARITSTTKGLAGWRERIALAAHGAGVPYREEGAVEVGVSFRFPRPKSHYRGNGPDGKPILRESCAERPHVSRPDLDKLVRAVLDGLTGIAYRDDSQVTVLAASKLYAPEFGEPGVWIRVSSSSWPPSALPCPSVPCGTGSRGPTSSGWAGRCCGSAGRCWSMWSSLSDGFPSCKLLARCVLTGSLRAKRLRPGGFLTGSSRRGSLAILAACRRPRGQSSRSAWTEHRRR